MGLDQKLNHFMCIRPIVFILLILLLPFHSTAQLSPETLDTLDQLFKESKYIEYLEKIIKLEKSIKVGDPEINCKLEELTPLVERQIKSTDPNIIFKQRKTYKEHALSYKKKLGNYTTALKYYLIAHSLVKDKLRLDSLAWTIENEILNIYTRQDDFEKGSYYGILVVENLKKNKQWNNLSKSYANLGNNFYWADNLKESKINYLKGLNIANQKKYNRGIFTNSLGLVQIYLDLKVIDSLLKYLNLCEKTLPLIKGENKYLEYKSDFENKKSKFFEMKNYRNLCLEWSWKSISTLIEFYNKNTNSRELAKAYQTHGMKFLRFNQLDSADYYFQKGMHCLIHGDDNLFNIIDRHLLYQENAFIELFDLKTNILKKQFENTHNVTQLEEALIYNELILWLNNNTTQNTLGDNTKLLNISDSKKYVGIGLDLLNTLNNNKKINFSDSIFRNYFNYSKAQLINTKLINKLIVDQLDKKTKIKIDILNDSIISLESNSERSNDQYLHLIQTKIELENIIKQAEQTIFKKIYPKNYIEYSVQQDYIYRFAQLNNKVYFKRIGGTAIFDSLFNSFNNALSYEDSRLNNSIYRKISDFLLQGIDSILPFEFTVIPDANISFIPFDCLKDPFNKNLIERHLISYSHTYGNLISNDYSTKKEIYTLAPQYPFSDLAPLNRGFIYELKNAVEECQHIQNYYPEAKSLNRHITKNYLLDTLTNASIFHFAGHGKVSNDSSYLMLANNEELLRYEDISNYYNNMDLVVLSACETGLGTWNPGDGSKSLAKAFIESGTGAVVYSLWEMNDISTQKIMAYMYKYLSEGQAKDEALRNAKLSYINESSGNEKQNIYWAGFVVCGDLSKLNLLNSPINTDFILISIIFILIIIVIIYLKYYSLKI